MTAMNQARSSSQRFYVLDGMRGIAAIIVMLYHYIGSGQSRLLMNSYIAVDLFFILSGFVIYHAYAKALRDGMPAGVYANKRISRLAPTVAGGVVLGAIAMLIALRWFLYNSKLGKALRACAQDPETASLQGIKVRNMTMLAMAIAGASAGLAGGLMAPIAAITPYMGHHIVIIAFIVIVVGGMASVGGAVVAAIILGFIHTFVTTLVDSTTAAMVGVGIMALTLVVRPQGLLGRETT